MPVGVGLLRRIVAQQLGRVDRDFLDLRPVHLEHDVAPGGRHGVVNVDDGLLRAAQAFEGGGDQIIASLGQHLREDVIGDRAVADETGDEVELGRARAGEADLDLLDADPNQQVEEAALLLGIHRVDQRLIAVAHVGREPARRRGDDGAGPLAIGQIHLREGAVFLRRVGQHHGKLLLCKRAARSWPGGTTICLDMPLGGLLRHSSEEQQKCHA